MLEKFYKILMMVAMAVMLGHNFMPHHHIEVSVYHDGHHEDSEQDKEHHNIFSFAQLDENFLPSQSNSINIDLPIAYLLTPLITYQLRQIQQPSKTHFGYYREYPPPDTYLSDLPLRAPPFSVAV